MAITIKNSGGGNFTGSPATLSATVDPLTNYLVVGIASNSNSNSQSGVTAGGVAMTNLGTNSSSTGGSESLWGLASPPTGTINIVASYSGSANVSIGYIALQGVNITTPTGNGGSTNSGSSAGSSSSISFSTTYATSLIIDILYDSGSSSATPGGGQNTQVSQVPTSGAGMHMSTKPTTTITSYTMSWSFSNGGYSQMAREFAEAIPANVSITDTVTGSDNLSTIGRGRSVSITETVTATDNLKLIGTGIAVNIVDVVTASDLLLAIQATIWQIETVAVSTIWVINYN